MLLRVLCENPQALGALVQVQGALVCAKGPLVFVCAWGAGGGCRQAGAIGCLCWF
jgi:hypothetical protein